LSVPLISGAQVFDISAAAERTKAMTPSSQSSPIANIIPGIIPSIMVPLIRRALEHVEGAAFQPAVLEGSKAKK